jgi:hypothetical protein
VQLQPQLFRTTRSLLIIPRPPLQPLLALGPAQGVSLGANEHAGGGASQRLQISSACLM